MEKYHIQEKIEKLKQGKINPTDLLKSINIK